MAQEIEFYACTVRWDGEGLEFSRKNYRDSAKPFLQRQDFQEFFLWLLTLERERAEWSADDDRLG